MQALYALRRDAFKISHFLLELQSRTSQLYKHQQYCQDVVAIAPTPAQLSICHTKADIAEELFSSPTIQPP